MRGVSTATSIFFISSSLWLVVVNQCIAKIGANGRFFWQWNWWKIAICGFSLCSHSRIVMLADQQFAFISFVYNSSEAVILNETNVCCGDLTATISVFSGPVQTVWRCKWRFCGVRSTQVVFFNTNSDERLWKIGRIGAWSATTRHTIFQREHFTKLRLRFYQC